MQDCYWRTATLNSLRQAGRSFEIAHVAETESEHFGAVLAGKAVTVTIGTTVPAGLRLADARDGLPPLPDLGVSMVATNGPRHPATDRLAELILATFQVP